MISFMTDIWGGARSSKKAFNFTINKIDFKGIIINGGLFLLLVQRKKQWDFHFIKLLNLITTNK